jgi:EAL domain-containing protein (putative c-di-GMP-specific phosphodiesterase class I)
MRAADLALHAAKVQGGGHVVYTPALGNEVADRVRIVDEVRRAIDNDELVLHYQPQVALDSGRLVSVEALLRWQHPERGLIAPGEFLSAVEDHVIINRITSVVLHKALSQIKVWQAQGRSIPVSVNVASRSLMNVGFPAEVAALLDEYGVEPQLLCLELTETTVMQDPARCGRTLQALHGLGVRLSMDDYGTGYASIAHLKNLPLDELKVDRSFVSRMMHDAQYRVLTESIVDLGHNLGLTVVAEGVEDADASYALSAFGCDLAQGYLYCRPVAPDEIPNWQAPGASAAVHAAIPVQRAPQMCPTLEPVDRRRAADSLTLHYGQLRYQAG